MGLWTRVRLPPIPLKKLSSEAFQKDMKVQKRYPAIAEYLFLYKLMLHFCKRSNMQAVIIHIQFFICHRLLPHQC